MTNVRFNYLLQHPLNHFMYDARYVLVARALRYVVDSNGPSGEAALEEYCRKLQRRDNLTVGGSALENYSRGQGESNHATPGSKGRTHKPNI